MSGRARMRLAAVALAGAIGAGCATGGFVRPSGTPTPFPDGPLVWDGLTRACGDVSAYQAQLRVSGRVNGQRVPGLDAGLALDAGRLAMMARAGARNVFHIAGRAEGLTLLLQLDGRVVRGPAVDVIDALVGVRVEPAQLLAALTGCLMADADVTATERVGRLARITTADGIVYLRPRGSDWHLAASEFDGIIVDYRRVVEGWPRDLVIRQGSEVALRFEVIEFVRNPPLQPGLFEVSVPASYIEVPAASLRDDGAFATPD